MPRVTLAEINNDKKKRGYVFSDEGRKQKSEKIKAYWANWRVKKGQEKGF